MNIKWIVWLVVLLFSMIFAVQNYELVQVRFFIWSFKMSQALIIFLSATIGFMASELVMLFKKITHKKDTDIHNEKTTQHTL